MIGVRTAYIVIDLGFGDAGKGLVTDWLARSSEAPLVVRFNGGAQAGHNVVTPDGRTHTFAQFGAATFTGAHTFLSRHMIVHPTTLRVEAAALERCGIARPLDRVRISERARVVTPLHQAMNRLRELARGDARHGSCGVGVGEVVKDSLAHPDDVVCAAELRDRSRLRDKLERIRARMLADVESLGLASSPRVDAERDMFTTSRACIAWLEHVEPVAPLVAPDDDWRQHGGTVIFEGAQGVLLDENHGYHPHTTWSTCTPANAEELLAGSDYEPVRIGVVRSHAVRHGPGPLPSEHAVMRPMSDHNRDNEWQGPVRYGWFDPVLTRYALAAAGPLDQLVLTHLDAWPQIGGFRWSTGGTLWGPRTAEHRDNADAAAVLARTEQLLERPIAVYSQGPCSTDVRPRASAVRSG